jgi:DNA polymerase III subunit epsilon
VDWTWTRAAASTSGSCRQTVLGSCRRWLPGTGRKPRSRAERRRGRTLGGVRFRIRSETIDILPSPEYRAAMTSSPGLATTRELIVLDFETTGLTPSFDRTIEVAATLLVNQRPVDTFHQLMHPGMRLPSFITSLTGITDEMLRGQPRPEQVMPRLSQFVRGLPVVAHNAAFDRGFLRAEMDRAGLPLDSEFLCTMRLARRLAPGLPTYRLDALVDLLQVRAPNARQFHRAVADVNHTVEIWRNLHARFTEQTGLHEPPISLLGTLMRKPKKQVPQYLATLRAGRGQNTRVERSAAVQ